MTPEERRELEHYKMRVMRLERTLDAFRGVANQDFAEDQHQDARIRALRGLFFQMAEYAGIPQAHCGARFLEWYRKWYDQFLWIAEDGSTRPKNVPQSNQDTTQS